LRRRLSALAIVLAACGATGGVTDTPPAPAFTTTTFPSVNVPHVTAATVGSGITEAEVSELESVLDEIEDLITETEQLLDEPLP
jgi:PBP1b-binding outer membrane lipoprotein LpoB